jgi:hypothetical protein
MRLLDGRLLLRLIDFIIHYIQHDCLCCVFTVGRNEECFLAFDYQSCCLFKKCVVKKIVKFTKTFLTSFAAETAAFCFVVPIQLLLALTKTQLEHLLLVV